jgi:ribosomal-protein-alanine N-acetyltransferase
MFEADFPYVVETMRLEDVPQVMAIERESFPLPWPERAYRYELSKNQHSHYVVLRPASVLVPALRRTRLKRFLLKDPPTPILGYGGFWMIAGEAHISTLAVASNWRERGLGELLLWSMLDRAAAMGAFEATLEVRVSNHVAQNLYRKYGFEKVGQRQRYYQDNGENAWIMTVSDFDSKDYQARFRRLGRALHQQLRQDSQR